jgi:hypothetical protein
MRMKAIALLARLSMTSLRRVANGLLVLVVLLSVIGCSDGDVPFSGEPSQASVNAVFFGSGGEKRVLVGLSHENSVLSVQSPAKLSCEGVDLPHAGGGLHGAGIPVKPPGQTYTCTYVSDIGTVASFAVDIPEAPIVTSPTANSTITRSNPPNLIYHPSGCDAVSVAVSYEESTGHASALSDRESDDGEASLPNLDNVPLGPGELDATRYCEDAHSGTGFESVTTTISASSASIPISLS